MEEKRRLPLWMLGASTANKASKTLETDANSAINNEESSVVTESTKPKAKRVTRKKKNDDCIPKDEKSFLVKCETKKKKRGFVEKDVIEGRDHEQEIVVEKRKRGRVGKKDEDQATRKKKEKKNEFESGNENHDPSCDDEDDDLTMEDLLSIAKEFVENDKSDTCQQQKPSEGKYELKSKSSFTSSTLEETDSRHDSVENITNKVTLTDFRTTGDPAQDMLDLFLGPLLKKPIKKEEPSSIKEIIRPDEIKKQLHDVVISDKPVITTKKKSSLRDAVAMLLD